MTAAFPPGRPRVWVLVAFLVLFVSGTTALLMSRTQVRRPAGDLLSRTADLHTLVSGSLALSGLRPEEVLAEEEERRDGPHGPWNSYRTEIHVGDSFSLEGWAGGLAAALARAGASLDSSSTKDEMVFRVFYHPPEGDGPLLVESLTVRVRPTPESLAPGGGGGAARAAIVIDDLGQSMAHLRRLAALDLPMTLSVLPGLPHSRSIAEKAAGKGMDVLLHIPMEPVDFPEKRPGPGALLAQMSEEQIIGQLKANLVAVPGVVGVNNHMGSLLTTDARVMGVLMKELKSRGLLFLDSVTSPHSLAFDTAYRYNLPAARRDIFLDAHDDKEFIRGQVKELLHLARRKGSAIGIGHPYRSTLAVLEEMRDEIAASGIELVTVSSLTVKAYSPGEAAVSAGSRPGAAEDAP